MTVAGIDLSAIEFWGLPLPERAASFALVRAEPRPQFFAEPEVAFTEKGPGYYALVRYADVVEASRHPEVFSSRQGATSIADLPAGFNEYFGSMINMDDPRHARLRRIVSRAFTPQMIARFEDDVRRAATAITDDLLAAGPCDFVSHVAARLPLKIICDIDGEQLTSAELASFFVLLVVAGNETTRNALSHALMLLTEFPQQRALLLADLEKRIGGAIEEIVRYASPVLFMRRTLTRDYTMNGQDYREGDKVVLFYYSANRDETMFTDPERFDITRLPNPHVGFGAPGPHFCLGSHLARRELTVMLRELLTRVPDITAGEPDRLLSNFVNGIKRLSCEFSS